MQQSPHHADIQTLIKKAKHCRAWNETGNATGFLGIPPSPLLEKNNDDLPVRWGSDFLIPFH